MKIQALCSTFLFFLVTPLLPQLQSILQNFPTLCPLQLCMAAQSRAGSITYPTSHMQYSCVQGRLRTPPLHQS